MFRFQIERRFGEMAAHVAAQDQQLEQATRWFMGASGVHITREPDLIEVSIDLSDRYGLDPDQTNRAMEICEGRVSDEMTGNLPRQI